MLEGRGLHESTNVRARGLASSINDRSLNIGGTAYAADSMVNNSGQQVLRIRSRLNKNPLNVFAGPGYENNVRIYRDGTIDIIGGTKSIPSITTRNQVVGQETYRYLIVGETRGANAGRISRPTNDLPPEYGRSTKTVNGVHYFATNTTPNVSSPDEREFLIGASMQFLKPEPKPQVSTPEPKKPSVSSRPGNNPPGERPDLPAAESGPTSTTTDLPADAVGIPTQPVQHLDVGAEIPHTYTPTNTPYDPFAT